MNIDLRSEANIKTLDPKCQERFRKWLKDAKEIANDYECDYIVISGNRTWKEQDALYEQGRTKPGNRVTNARGGQSNHNFGIAVDCGVFENGHYLDDEDSVYGNPALANEVHKAVARDIKDYGFEWGGNWKSIKDYPHFEVSTGLSLSQKRNLYTKNGSVL